jgi:hypothetical protein
MNFERTQIVIYKTAEADVSLSADFRNETLWATQPQVADLFGIDRTTVVRHIKNILKSAEVDAESNVQKMHIAGSDKPVMFYSLDMILAVGYRTNSHRAIAFRQWATSVLRQHLVQGYTLNTNRLAQLNRMIEVISRNNTPEIAGISAVLQQK